MALPTSIVAGADVSWTDTSVSVSASSATVYLRPTSGTGGVAVSGVEGAEGWDFTIAAVDTAAMNVGIWLAQGVAVVAGANLFWLPITRVQVTPSLVFLGDPGALDLRSATEQELEQVRAAIRAVYKGQEYEIGAGRYMGRRLLRADLRWLEQREQTLLLRLEAERTGGRNRRILIEFTP